MAYSFGYAVVIVLLHYLHLYPDDFDLISEKEAAVASCDFGNVVVVVVVHYQLD